MTKRSGKPAAWIGRCVRTVILAVAVLPSGCSGTTGDREAKKPVREAEIKAAREKLPPADRELVEAQNYCPIMSDRRLGEMGEPFKLTIKDTPVFLCCKGCRKKAEGDPERTLAKVEELKLRHKPVDK